MCRGGEKEEVAIRQEGLGLELCELCGLEASLYCQADDAFLCRKCDKNVHGANFLAQRHIRCLICSCCRGFTQRYLVGSSVEVVLPSIVLNRERRCNGGSEGNCSREVVKMPFLFL